MAKPKKKRDLRARLGRTITPKTKGAAGAPAAPPPGVGAPPPSPGGAAPAQPAAPAAAKPARERKVTPPPAGLTPPPSGIAAPPAGIGASAPSSAIAAPPFAQPAAAPAAPAAPADPFAAAQPSAQQQVVRLEFDDRLVSDAEVGKKKTFMVAIVAGVALAAGLGIGFFGGSTFENNKIFERTVRDAQSIYGSINEASTTINAAQRHMNTIVATAAGNEAEGAAPGVDYDTIEALRALERPFTAAEFTDKNYNAFPANTVHDLFQYLMNVERLWQEFNRLAGSTLAASAREELDRTAAATAEGASTQYAVVMTRTEEGGLIGGLAFLSEAPEGSDPGTALARASRAGRGRVMHVYHALEGQEIETGAPNWTMLVDGAASRGVLAEQTGAFGRFLMKLRELKPLIDQTVEIQGRLLTAISGALTEAGATVGAPSGGGEE